MQNKKNTKDRACAIVQDTKIAKNEFKDILQASNKNVQHAKKEEQKVKKEKRNSELTIKTYVEQFILVSCCTHVSSCHGGDFEGNSCRRLMKDGDLMFKDAKQHLLQGLDSHSLGNDDAAIERNEIEDSCNKYGKTQREGNTLQQCIMNLLRI